MKKVIILLFISFLIVSCHNSNKEIISSKVVGRDTLTYKVFMVNGGWGYDVIINGKVFIHQPFIPAVQGKFPFLTKEDARKTAILVIEKLITKKGMPSVTVKELQDLGVLYDTVLRYQDNMFRKNFNNQ